MADMTKRAPTASDRRRQRLSAVAEAADVRRALDALRRIVQALRGAGREAERDVGLTAAQLFALQRIAERPGCSVNEIAALTFTHQSSVSVVIQRLVDRRLVAKITAPDDRRRQQLQLTANGRRLLSRAPGAVQDRLIGAIADLSGAERRALGRGLGRVASILAPAAADEHPPMLFEESRQRKRAAMARGNSGK
jgi:DNA-binding MarR family transcriptional regulator